VGGVWVRRRGGVLTRGGVPQIGATPLHSAAEHGHAAVVRVLVEAGADKNAPNKVREGRGGEGMVCAQKVCGFLAGGCIKAAECRRADEVW
jgi:hypothetical protein